MRILSIETPTHGRALIEDSAWPSSRRLLLVGFHGYGQSAEDMLAELKRVPGSEQWTLASLQALHRFYGREQKIVASWMTRQDRELAIADNIRYVDSVLRALLVTSAYDAVVFAGFSQGVAMAYRAGVLGANRPACIIAVGGDLPPDLKSVPALSFPPIFIAAGDSDPFYTPAKVDADEQWLRSHGLWPEVFRYPAGHEWTDELRVRLAVVLTQWSSGGGRNPG
jgi:predicted esterase